MQLWATTVTYVSVGALVAWRMYARVRKMVGRQRLSKWRAPVTLIIFPLIVLLLALASLQRPDNLLWLGLALAAGAGLGRFGLSRTHFEAVPGEGLFYTPDTWLGVALSLLFMGRVAYRLYEVYVHSPALERNSVEFAQSGLTLAVFGLLAGYYISYALGLALWRRRVLRAKKAREAELPEPPP